MLSYWEQKSFFYHRHLIVCGAGFTGLSAAIYYKRLNPGRSVLVIEKDAINGGASTKNAGFACFGSASELIADLRISSEDSVFELVERRWKGLQNLRSLLGDEAIGYEHGHGFELFKNQDHLYDDCAGRLDYLNDQLRQIAGRPAYRHSDEKIRQFGFAGIAHIIENTLEGQVDTGKMYSALLKLARETGVEVFNGITVSAIEDGSHPRVITDRGPVTCDKILIATNGFASQFMSDSQTLPARAQVLVTSPVVGLKIRGSFHINEGYYYFRDIGGRVLFGGGRNLDFEGETTTELELNDEIQEDLERWLRDIIIPGQEFRIENRWSGIMGMGSEKQVIVKQVSVNVFCAIRLSGMGLALSTIIGKEVAAMII